MRVTTLRELGPTVIVQGMHRGIIQSMLDYDFILGRKKPSIIGVIAKGRKKERFFWGGAEIGLPVYVSISEIEEKLVNQVTFIVNVQSSRNIKASIQEALEQVPKLKLAVIFAEGTPEIHSQYVAKKAKGKGVVVVGPSSVGVLIPGVIKLGAIGGTTYDQLIEARIDKPGDVAIITTSGGMVNELIRVVTSKGRRVSFAVAMGGDRYPAFDPIAAMLIAEDDPETKEIIYFGELGGTDEHEIARLIQQGKITKRVIIYIAGVVAELFSTPPQFGHAKALAQSPNESARSKKDALKLAGAIVCDRFDEVSESINKQPLQELEPTPQFIERRHRAYFMSHLSGEHNGNIQLLGSDLLDLVQDNTLASLVLSVTLGHKVTSERLINFTDFVLKLLIDHSPNVSGAVNTMITTRAGKDMVSSLTAGLLTIGPRFGGAINGAAEVWLDGVERGIDVGDFVEELSKKNGIIPGIGHKKYGLDNPDPRVQALLDFMHSSSMRYLDFARSVEIVTTGKKSNLILNVDGAIAAVMLDLLSSELDYSTEQLRELVSIEFFNSLFIIGRSVGFLGHYLDQRRNDEGLFRLDDGDLVYFS
ncbi:MAG: citrate/2-methylcitrate synthase [Patescibacteria group bacterium]